MFFDRRKIKHYHKVFNDDSIDLILQAAKDQLIERDAIDFGQPCNGKYLHIEPFYHTIQPLEKEVHSLVSKHHKVNCTLVEVMFIHYINGSHHRPHTDGQRMEDEYAVPGNDRDLTAVLYLNEEYDGGELYFTFLDYSIKPKKGDLITYPTTFQYRHGVNKVQGNRYAISFWYTSDPKINVKTYIPDAAVRKILRTFK